MALDDAAKERLAKLRDDQAKKEQAEQEAADARELEALELSAKLEGELDGPRDVAFAIVNNRFGVFALKRPDTGAIRRWERAKDKDKQDLEWMIGFLRPQILPTDKALPWAQTCAQRPGLCWQTANAFIDLMGVDRDALAKK